MKRIMWTIVCVLGLIGTSGAVAQADTVVVCGNCIPVITVDTIVDTTKTVARIDTTWADSIQIRFVTRVVYRDSVVITHPTTRPFEPAGAIKLTELTFDKSGEGNWSAAGGYTTAPDAVCSAPTVRRYTKSIGTQTANSFSPGVSTLSIPGQKELYFYGCFRLSPTFDGNASNTNKLGPFFGLAKGPQIFFNAQGHGTTAPLYAHINVQGLVPSAGGVTATGDGTFGGSVVQIVRGKWYMVVITMKVNVWGQNNGTMSAWLIDPQTKTTTQFVSKTNLGYIGAKTYPTTTASSMFDFLRMNAIWGGGLGTITAPTWIEWDHIYVSGK